MERCKTILVVGTSIDGKISPGRGISSKNFGAYLPRKVNLELHKLRSNVDGILVSSSTVLIDNPSLTARDVVIKKRPFRIVLDRLGKTPNNAKILNNEANTIVITSKKGKSKFAEIPDNVRIIICKTDSRGIILNEALIKLRRLGIKKILIEGGGTINNSLFSKNLIDKLIVFIFPLIVGGKETPTMVDGEGSFYANLKKMNLKSVKKVEGCLMNTYEND